MKLLYTLAVGKTRCALIPIKRRGGFLGWLFRHLCSICHVMRIAQTTRNVKRSSLHYREARVSSVTTPW